MNRIYLDHNATTPVLPRVKDAVLRALDVVGNPSSTHAPGRAARAVLDRARREVAAAAGVDADAVTFTSGGTEALALGVSAAATALAASGDRVTIWTTAIEHAALLTAASALTNCDNMRVERLPIDAAGRVDPRDLADALTDGQGASLVAVASANNEVGTRQPVAALCEVARSNGALTLIDAVQSLGKEPVDASAWGADLVAVSAHKIGGPKGVGALLVRDGTPFAPAGRGGSQELGRRGGTEALPLIAGFGAAAAALGDRLAAGPAVRRRRDSLRERLDEVADIAWHGDPRRGLGNTLSLTVGGVKGDALRVALDLAGLACSSGSACASGAVEPSHVLLALGVPPARARAALRLSLGPETTDADVDRAAEVIASVVARLRR